MPPNSLVVSLKLSSEVIKYNDLHFISANLGQAWGNDRPIRESSVNWNSSSRRLPHFHIQPLHYLGNHPVYFIGSGVIAFFLQETLRFAQVLDLCFR